MLFFVTFFNPLILFHLQSLSSHHIEKCFHLLNLKLYLLNFILQHLNLSLWEIRNNYSFININQ